MIASTTCLSPFETWQARCIATKQRAVDDMVELVEGPDDGKEPKPINDPILWVHRAFDLYRTAMTENDLWIGRLARVEYDFIAALCALNFDHQTKQHSLALESMKAFRD